MWRDRGVKCPEPMDTVLQDLRFALRSSVSAYAVNHRTQEIGVQIALGARSADVLAMIMGEALVAGLAGVSAGLIASRALARTLSGLLHGVAPTDRFAYLGAAALLLMVVLIACYVPARRAARLDPATRLRT